jgi:hypothetical protein
MPEPSDPDLLVLLGLRLRAVATAEALVSTTGLPAHEVADRLAAFDGSGLVTFRDGRLSGWMLTTRGRVEGERRLAAELDATGTRAAVGHAYQRFLAINQQLLDTCTAWQLRPVDGATVVNDHADAAHDAVVLARLVTIDDAVQPVVSDLAEALARFGGYGPRLAAALAKVQGGDADWFAAPTIDSYHAVWFELHESLLATLGIERAREAVTTSP